MALCDRNFNHLMQNAKLAAELFSVPGARQLLLLAGFEPWRELSEDGSVLVLPAAVRSKTSFADAAHWLWETGCPEHVPLPSDAARPGRSWRAS